ncbi:FecR family protein [Confluentibacter sediminis]|uniref:FecR family protein n=1 Tax=Confluentibacter sediminis TaxID=2219045 RepID=UPI000DAE6DA0|nr:FecR family protein [Confluentibacter sediminis]
MTKKELYDLLLKFEKGECTTGEENLLFQFYNEFQKKDSMASWDLSEKEDARIRLLERINSTIQSSQVKRIKRIEWRKIASIAALFIGFAFTGFLYINNNLTAYIPENAITLQLEDGSVKVIKVDGAIQVLDVKGQIVGKQKGTQLVYTTKQTDKKDKDLAYNTLTVPYGKTFNLQLSDGTTVYLNAGTSIKYPVCFIEGTDRHVFVTGEAYLNVAKDAKHPFIVSADNLNVRVLGTQFNVNAYPEDNESEIVLVEGSVSLYNQDETYTSDKSTSLKPGFKANFNKHTKSIKKEAVLTDIYTSWRTGELVFRDMPFENILKKLERKYNVKIINTNPKLSKEKFQASFGKNPAIVTVLEELKTVYNIGYTVKENTIIIK